MMMSNPPVSFDETRKSLRTPGGLTAWRSHLGAQEHRSDLEPPPASHLLRFPFPGSAAIRCHGSCQVPGRSSETRPCLLPQLPDGSRGGQSTLSRSQHREQLLGSSSSTAPASLTWSFAGPLASSMPGLCDEKEQDRRQQGRTFLAGIRSLFLLLSLPARPRLAS